MKAPIRLSIAVVGCLAQLLAAGCTTKVHGLYRSETFTYPAASSGGVAVGGVVSAVVPLTPAERNLYGNLLHGALRSECEGYRLVSPGVLADRFGFERYHPMLDEYRDYGLLSEDHLQALKQELRDVRYAAFARIDDDTVTHDRRESSIYEDDDVVGQDVELVTERAVSVFMTIYDLQEGGVAWSGTVNESVSRETSHTRREHKKTAVAILEAIFGGEPVHPEPPALSEALRSAFRGFAENMPQPES